MTSGLGILRNRWFLGASLLGTLVMGVAWEIGTLSIQISLAGTFVSMLAGLLLALINELDAMAGEAREALLRLGVVLPVLADPELRTAYRETAGAFQKIAEADDMLFRELAVERSASLSRDFRNLARQRLVYVGTEAWRNAYARVLNQPGITQYQSVSWVRSLDYWQDQPGLQSLRLNCELVKRGVELTRIVIARTADVCDRNGQLKEPLLSWMQTQQRAGIRLRYLSEEALHREEDLLSDFGIYDAMAVGVQETDSSSRTLQFRLSFDPDDLRIFRNKWNRLQLYASEWSSSV